ncbi:MAG: ATP-binding protein, partial [Candidatus Binatia bacterium]
GRPVISFTSPIYDQQGKFRGMVHNEVKMSFIAKAVQDIGMGENASATLTRKDGIVIADQDGVDHSLNRLVAHLHSFQEASKGRVGVLREKDSYGMDSFISYAPLRGYSTFPGLGWSLLISQGVDEVYAYAKDQARIFSLMVLIGTTLILVGGYFFLAQWISKPIHRLTEGVKALGTEGFEAKLDAIDVRGSDEIGRLTASFKQMVNDLKAKEEKQKELQEQLIQADKLASLGELSAGIAHEIGNPLTAIKTTAQVMEEEMEHDSPHREYVQRIVKEIDRLNAILRAFFSFAKPQKPHPTWCDVRELAKEVQLLINKDAAKHQVTIQEEYAEGLPLILVDFQQIQQVLLNLSLNALQAMPEGGRLSIKAEAVPSGEGGESAILLSVADTGKRISPEHLKKIFDPFFTTRLQGTGLGLSIAYQIIDKHGGKIKVESQPGWGTTFTIVLPVLGPPSMVETNACAAPASQPS